MKHKGRELPPGMAERILKAQGEAEPTWKHPVLTKPVTGRGTQVAHKMNKWEKSYQQTLLLRLAAGEILWFDFEPCKFKLGNDWKTTYTPDFGVMLADRTIEFHEVKGFWRDDAKVKIKVAASMLPFVFVIVTKGHKGMGWDLQPVAKAQEE